MLQIIKCLIQHTQFPHCLVYQYHNQAVWQRAVFTSREVTQLYITLCDPYHVCRLFPVPWWGYHLGQHDGAWWLTTLDPAVLHSMPSRQRLGVLNAAHDLVKHLGHKLKPFLPEMCALVLVLLQGSSLNSNQVQLMVICVALVTDQLQCNNHTQSFGCAQHQPSQNCTICLDCRKAHLDKTMQKIVMLYDEPRGLADNALCILDPCQPYLLRPCSICSVPHDTSNSDEMQLHVSHD